MANQDYKIRIIVDNRSAKAEARETASALGGVRQAAKLAATAFAAIGAARLAREFVDLSKASVQAALSMERIQRVLSADQFGFARSEANRLGLDLETTAKSYAQLTAAAAGTALEGEKSERIFSAVASAMRALGRTSAETEGALNAIQQMISKGNVQAEELRGQLGERLPGAFQDAAKAMGVTTQGLNKMLDTGQVLATDLLPALATVLEEKYGDVAEDASKRAEAAMGRASTAVFELKAAFGERLLPAIQDAAEKMVAFASDERVVEGIREAGDAVGELTNSLVELFEVGARADKDSGPVAEIKRIIDFAREGVDAINQLISKNNELLSARDARREIFARRRAAGESGEELLRPIPPAQIQAEIAAMEDRSRAVSEYRRKLLEASKEHSRHLDELANMSTANKDLASSINRVVPPMEKVTEAAKKQAAELSRLRERKRELATEVGQLTQALANQAEVWAVLDARMADFSSGTLEVPTPSIDTDDWVDAITRDALPEIEDEYEALFAWMNENISANLTEGVQRALSAGLSEFFRSGEADFESFFRDIGDLAADILGEALAARLTKVIEDRLKDGKLKDLFKGGTGTALALGITASNIANANDQGYAAAGALIGAAIGGAVAAYFTGGLGAGEGAALGASIGSWIGGMIKSGAPRFFGALKEEAGQINLVGQLAQVGGTMGQDIREGVERLLSALGGELEGLGATIGLEMREGLAVTVDGIRTYFDSEHIAEGIQFAIVEALKNADISGISDEARAALNNTMADTMEELLSDLDFARWIEQLNLTDSAKALDDFVDQFRVAWDRMVKLGIDGADKLAQWAAKSLEDQRRSILGIQETAKERITREAQAFNAQLQLIRAEQEAKRAELMIQKAQLEANVSFLKAYGDIVGQRLELDGLLLKGERNLLQGKIGMLEAIDSALAAVDALLGSLPDLISNADIRKAINRAGRGAGGPSGPTQADRDAALLGMQDFGLSDAARQLAAATRFVEEHMRTVAELGFSEEELMEIRRQAQAEQDKLIRDLGRGALAALGTTSVATIQRMQDLGLQLLHLRENFEALGLKLWQVESAAVELGKEITLSIASGLAQYVEDAEVRRQLQILEHDLFMRQKAVEIQAAHTMGLITQQQLEFLQGVLSLAKDWKPPEVETVRFSRTVRSTFSDARRDAERIAESFARAKGDLADFLNRVLVGEFGGTSPVGGVLEAQRQYDEVLRQAQTGNIGAIGELGDFGATLLRLAQDAYASGPEFQAIRDYVLSTGADILSLRQGREGNVVFDERFITGQQTQTSELQQMKQLLARIDQHLSRNGGAIVTGKAS